MALVDVLTILAITLSPLIAVQVTEWVQRRRSNRDRRLYVFRTLMATRSANLTPEHVAALNMIDVEFYGTDRKSKAVIEACKLYLDHHNRPIDPTGNWAARREDLLLDLLQKMGGCLGYEFDKVSIRHTSYFPQRFGDMEKEQEQIRKGLVAVLDGKKWVPVLALTPQDVAQYQPPQVAQPEQAHTSPPPAIPPPPLLTGEPGGQPPTTPKA